MPRRLLALLAAIGIAACSLATSLDDLSKGPVGSDDGGTRESGSATDAGREASDGGSADATSDAAPVVAWCLRQDAAPPFCIDFDDGNLGHAYQNGQVRAIPPPVTTGDASVATSYAASSLSGVFIADVPATSVGSRAAARYEAPVTVSAQAAYLRFDLRLITPTTGQQIDFAMLRLALPSSQIRCYVGITGSGKGQLFCDKDGTVLQQEFLLPPLDEWHTCEVAIANDVQLDAMVTFDKSGGTSVKFPTGLPQAAEASFFLGAAVDSPSKHVTVAIDNVTFFTR